MFQFFSFEHYSAALQQQQSAMKANSFFVIFECYIILNGISSIRLECCTKCYILFAMMKMKQRGRDQLESYVHDVERSSSLVEAVVVTVTIPHFVIAVMFQSHRSFSIVTMLLFFF